MESIYTSEPLENHFERLIAANRPVPPKPSYGIDSPVGLATSNIFFPLYLYTTKKGKFDAWDKLLDELPSDVFNSPGLDLGCGRGMVLLKIAERKKKLAASSPGTTIAPAYGIDLFINRDQSGNSPEATFDNAASLKLAEHIVLHTASFAELPFRDGSMSLVTASLSIHNPDLPIRDKAIAEAARVLKPGGYLLIFELAGYIGEYKKVLESSGWTDVQSNYGGLQTMFGFWPSQILKARKPAEAS
ncbi:hypothetical protein N7456_008690 [Penicillium angulare]|uniref:Methyltransferase type 11 domain-containing protein n=1 Tax=Penicillium angulare TaxID=116970 RepID=A0A9W9F3C5_9EURO|nr:hypothetical protein N7456_008690 [Penicillium angulare]